MRSEMTGGIAAIAAGTALAYLGNRWGALIAASPDPASEVFGSALQGTIPSIISDPLSLSSSIPALVCSSLLFCAPTLLWSWSLLRHTDVEVEGTHGKSRKGMVSEASAYKDRSNPDNNIILTRNLGIALRPGPGVRKGINNRNVLIVGGSGSGKTAGYVEPNILQLGADRDLVVIDTKGMDIKRCGMSLVRAGIEPVQLDLVDLDRSVKWNPLAAIETHAQVDTFVECLIRNTNNGRESNDPIWDNGERLLYQAILYLLLDWYPRSQFTLRSFFKFTSYLRVEEEGGRSRPCPVDLIFRQIETGIKVVPSGAAAGAQSGARQVHTSDGRRKVPTRMRRRDGKDPSAARLRRGAMRRGLSVTEDMALRKWRQFRSGAGKTLRSFVISSHARMTSLCSDDVLDMLSGIDGADELHLEQLGQDRVGTVVAEDGTIVSKGDRRPPRAIFVRTSDFDGKLNALLSILMWQAIFLPMSEADRQGGRLPRPVSIIMDEFKNIGKLPSFDQCIAVVRSRNIDLTVILQNLSQLKEVYGQEGTDTIRGNCATTVFLAGGQDYATARQLSEESGKRTITVQSETVHAGIVPDISYQYSQKDQEVFEASELAHMDAGHAVVWMGSEYPVEDAKSWVFEHRNYDPAYMFDPSDPPERHHEFDFSDWRENGSPLGSDAEQWRRSLEARQDAAHARMAVVEAEDDVRAAEESLARARGRAAERKANQLLEARRAILRRRLDERDRASAALEALEAKQMDCGNEKGRPGDDMVATMHWASTPAASRAARSVREKARRRASP